MLWYPCFENLFSIIRKNKFKNSPINPDNKHLHQLLYFYLKKNFSLRNLFANNLGSIIINSFNLIIFIIASNNYSSTIFQLFLIIFCIASYLLFYRFLFNYRFLKKNNLIIAIKIISPSLNAFTFFFTAILAFSFDGEEINL